MTSRRAQEPYTFAAFGEVPEAEPAAIQGALKDSVAAHQAECGCHPMNDDRTCCDPLAGGKLVAVVEIGRDSSGQPWHLDPLCKVRPEAKC